MQVNEALILAIDDDKITLEIVTDMLHQFGFTRIQTAGDGRSGLRSLDAMPEPASFVLVDVFMPDMDGIEFLGELVRRKFAGGVILMSAADPHMMQLARDIASESGLRLLATLTKPFLKPALARALGLTPAAVL